MVKITNIAYTKADLEQVAVDATHLNYNEIGMLIGLINVFEWLFDGTLLKWDTECAYIDLNPYSKPFNGRYYPDLSKNKEVNV